MYRFGRLGITFTTPPIAPFPYITDAGPPRNSMRSTLQVSNGKVSVPEATKSCAPSYSFMTELRPPNPRDIREPPPLPGAAWLVMPTIRVSASSTVTSPRCADRLARENRQAGRCFERA